MTDEAEFDTFSDIYEEVLGDGLRITGEDSVHFARGRVMWLSRRVSEHCRAPQTVLDFGCGTGSATPLLRDLLGARRVVGIDPSTRLLKRARAEYGSPGVEFRTPAEAQPGCADLAYCNGVLHHIDPSERATSVQLVWRALVPGGLFALWENNPWNPGTRLVMRRIAFDRDAITLAPPETRRLLRANGFEIICTDSLFYFPAVLRCLRPLERALVKVPLGAQYMVLAAKTA
jgi:SAM-dependent methyltransferase